MFRKLLRNNVMRIDYVQLQPCSDCWGFWVIIGLVEQIAQY